MPRRRAHLIRALALGVALAALRAPFASADPTDNYLEFDGVDDRVTVADSASLDIAGPVTFEAWIRPDTISNTKDQNRIVSKSADAELMISTGDTGCSFSTQGHVQWRTTIAGLNRRICGGVLVPGVWHHLAATYDGAQVALYVNGLRVASAARSGPITVNEYDLALGNHPTNSRPFDGGLDEVRVWNRALAQSEIQAKMNIELTGSEAGLVALLRLNEGSGQLASDGTIHGNPGRLGATTSTDLDDPQWVTSAPPVNQPPLVSAGPDRTIAFPTATIALDGAVSDDGLPGGAPLTEWTQLSGPAAMSFADARSIDTTATFAVAGVYTLRLSADDTEYLASDELVVTVLAAPELATIAVTPSSATVSPGGAKQFSAAGFDASGGAFPIAPVWTAQGGTISSSGLYTAGSMPGQYTITASDGAISGTAIVTVPAPTTIWPTQSWPTATPAQMGMSASKLEQARSYALSGGGSGFITRGGKLVMSWGSTTQRYDVKSVTKSIGSALLGVAVKDRRVALSDRAQQHLSSVGVPPDSNTATGWLDDITLSQLATHTAGFDKSGGFISLLYQPGTAWAYSDGGVNWLADVLTVKFRADLYSVLVSRVFTPIGISTSAFTWRANRYRSDTINGFKRREFASGISITVNAMAKVGYLFLRGGTWSSQQILQPEFVAAVRSPVAANVNLPVQNDTQIRFANAPRHYGILWWNNADGSMPGVPLDAYWAWGLGDSLIVVIPSLDIVAARAGSAWTTSHSPSIYVALAPFITPIAESVIQP